MNFFEKAFVSLTGHNHLKWLPDRLCVAILYRIHTHRRLRLNPPETFNEKLQWLKLHGHDPCYTRLSDKYEGKRIAASILGEAHVIPTLGVWDSFDEIPFGDLPDQFVLKCTHDCGSLVVCKDKASLDRAAAKRRLTQCLKRNYYWAGREWPYRDIPPRIIAEPYLTDEHVRDNPALDPAADGLLDYKFYCFGGEPKFLYVAFANMKNGVKRDQLSFFDLNWQPAPFCRLDHEPLPFPLEKPENLNDMIDMARRLAQGLSFVRVDLYNLNAQVYFSEMTFLPGSGFGLFHPDDWERRLGDWINLPDQR